MKAPLVRRLAIPLLLLQIGGCTSVQSHWPFGHEMPPVAHPLNHAHRQLPPAAVNEETSEEPEGSHHNQVRKEPATVSAPPQASPAPGKTTNVTLEDNDADHLRAQALVKDAAARLARIDRSKLTADGATAYNQASELANAARQAMAQQDYLAASGLARKATLLTEQLASRSSSR